VDITEYDYPNTDITTVLFYACYTWCGRDDEMVEEAGVFPRTWFSYDFTKVAVKPGCFAYKGHLEDAFSNILKVEADWIAWDVSRFPSEKAG